MPLALSILDQSTVASGRTPAEAVRETLALARLADAWGYRRYWLAEHHNSASHAGTAPEVLMAAIAATTQRIRIGSAGVMLPHYSALKVAEQFRVLEAIAPGRVDLGVGRAPGSDGRTAFALNPNAREAADRFPQQVQELLGWLGEGLPANHPFAGISAQPEGPTRPEVWILGSSEFGAQLAAWFGLPYCFAHFITDGRGSEEALALYRDGFRAQPGRAPAARAAVAVFALTAGPRRGVAALQVARAVAAVARPRHLPAAAERRGGRGPPLHAGGTREARPAEGARHRRRAGAGDREDRHAGRRAWRAGGRGADALPRPRRPADQLPPAR
jgi:luciferase family oxidoreductase group 1